MALELELLPLEPPEVAEEPAEVERAEPEAEPEALPPAGTTPVPVALAEPAAPAIDELEPARPAETEERADCAAVPFRAMALVLAAAVVTAPAAAPVELAAPRREVTCAEAADEPAAVGAGLR